MPITRFFVIINSISDFSLQYDEPLSLLRVEWASGADMRTFRASVGQLLQLSQELGVQHLLVDTNTMPDISVYDQLWLGANWRPGGLPLPLARMVLVVPRHRVHNQLAIDSFIALSRSLIKFDIQFFGTARSGLQWLCGHSNRLPALLTEWTALHGPGPAGVAEPRLMYQSRRSQ